MKEPVCDRSYSDDQPSNLFTRLHRDFQPFQSSKIRLVDVENMSNSCQKCHHIQIIQNKLYHVPRKTAFNYETRNLSVVLMLKHVTETFSDIPDLDVFFSVQDAVDLESAALNNAFFKVPIFGFTKTNPMIFGLRSDAIVLMPCFTFWSWPEVRIGRWSQIFSSIVAAAQRADYSKRIPKLFWRGVENWKRVWFLNMTSKYRDILDVIVMRWNTSVVGTSFAASSTYMTLERHCDYKYLANLEGNTYSARLKYILLCGSPVVHVPVHHWQEYWYHLLVPGKNIIVLDADRNESALNATLDLLRDNGSFVEQIGRQGQQLAQKYLNEHAVSCYWWKLLTEYGKLLAYKPTLHPNAMHIDDFIRSKAL